MELECHTSEAVGSRLVKTSKHCGFYTPSVKAKRRSLCKPSTTSLKFLLRNVMSCPYSLASCCAREPNIWHILATKASTFLSSFIATWILTHFSSASSSLYAPSVIGANERVEDGKLQNIKRCQDSIFATAAASVMIEAASWMQ